jgi:hypothetical protein
MYRYGPLVNEKPKTADLNTISKQRRSFMSTTNLTTISARIEKAAENLKVPTEKIQEILKAHDISNDEEGLKYLNSKIVTLEMLEEIFTEILCEIKPLKIKAAVMFLKGEDPFEEEIKSEEIPSGSVEVSNIINSSIVEFIQANKPIANLRDDELLNMWAKNRDEAYAQELTKRSKGQAFVVLKPGKHTPGKEEIDIELSLELLKSSRKRINPSIIPYVGNTFASVYKISELNIDDRIIETCPICGEILWKGYCSNCESNFAGVGDDERSFVKLVVDSGKINPKTVSDRKALVVSASKGIDDLIITWPSIRKEFEELKATGNLPKLRRIADRPSQTPVDPFHVSGNRSF